MGRLPVFVRPLLLPLLVLLLVLALLVALVWVFQRRLIYFPDPEPVRPAAEVFPDGRDATFETEDGLRLGAWYVPPSTGDKGLTVLVANGNAGSRADRTLLARALAELGLAVLLFDYRGYGGNPGSPTESGLQLDARAAHDYLVKTVGVPANRIVYFGESLGCGVMTRLAKERPPAGLVLRSPFVDLPAVGRAHYSYVPVGALLRDRYPIAEELATIAVPTAVVYGTSDSVVPPDQSREVARRAAGPVTVTAVSGADHNDRTLLDGPELIAAVERLVADLV